MIVLFHFVLIVSICRDVVCCASSSVQISWWRRFSSALLFCRVGPRTATNRLPMVCC